MGPPCASEASRPPWGVGWCPLETQGLGQGTSLPTSAPRWEDPASTSRVEAGGPAPRASWQPAGLALRPPHSTRFPRRSVGGAQGRSPCLEGQVQAPASPAGPSWRNPGELLLPTGLRCRPRPLQPSPRIPDTVLLWPLPLPIGSDDRSPTAATSPLAWPWPGRADPTCSHHCSFFSLPNGCCGNNTEGSRRGLRVGA